MTFAHFFTVIDGLRFAAGILTGEEWVSAFPHHIDQAADIAIFKPEATTLPRAKIREPRSGERLRLLGCNSGVIQSGVYTSGGLGCPGGAAVAPSGPSDWPSQEGKAEPCPPVLRVPPDEEATRGAPHGEVLADSDPFLGQPGTFCTPVAASLSGD